MAGATVTNNQANFTKSGQYVNLPSGLFGSYTAVSVEAWVTTTGINSGYAPIFIFGAASGTGSNDWIQICRKDILDTFQLSWFNSAGVQSYYISSALVDSQKNVHVLVTVSAGDFARLYINGVLQGSTPVVVTAIPPPSVFYIGRSFDVNPGLIGSVNEFRVWGGALSATDIATRYSQGPGLCMLVHLSICLSACLFVCVCVI